MKNYSKIDVNKCENEEESKLWENKEIFETWMKKVMSSKQYIWLIKYIEDNPEVSAFDLPAKLLEQFPEENELQNNSDAANMITNGVIVVISHGDNKKYTIENGHHRISMAKKLGYQFVYGKIE